MTLIFLVFPALSTPTFTATVHSLLISLDDKQQLLQHYGETVSACKWLENCIFKLVLAPSPPIILESEEKSHSVCSSSTPQLIDLHTSVTQMSWTIGHEPEVATLACVRQFDGKTITNNNWILKKKSAKPTDRTILKEPPTGTTHRTLESEKHKSETFHRPRDTERSGWPIPTSWPTPA